MIKGDTCVSRVSVIAEAKELAGSTEGEGFEGNRSMRDWFYVLSVKLQLLSSGEGDTLHKEQKYSVRKYLYKCDC